MHWGVAGVILLALFPFGRAQDTASSRTGARAADADLEYTLRVKWKGGRFGRAPEKLRIELRVKNTGREPTRLAFTRSGRVCGVIHDPHDRPFYRFPEVTAPVVGSEDFPPGKERVFEYEVPSTELRKLPPGTCAVAVWLCGYGELRHWAEFEAPYSLQDAKE